MWKLLKKIKIKMCCYSECAMNDDLRKELDEIKRLKLIQKNAVRFQISNL
jgi:hypothetical protein